MDNGNTQQQSFFKDVWNNVVSGWQVVFSEINWLLVKAFRRWEIKQMNKRLNEEYQILGKTFAAFAKEEKALSPQDAEAELPLKQIAFLQEEMEHMEQELRTSRSDYIKRRSQS